MSETASQIPDETSTMSEDGSKDDPNKIKNTIVQSNEAEVIEIFDEIENEEQPTNMMKNESSQVEEHQSSNDDAEQMINKDEQPISHETLKSSLEPNAKQDPDQVVEQSIDNLEQSTNKDEQLISDETLKNCQTNAKQAKPEVDQPSNNYLQPPTKDDSKETFIKSEDEILTDHSIQDSDHSSDLNEFTEVTFKVPFEETDVKPEPNVINSIELHAEQLSEQPSSLKDMKKAAKVTVSNVSPNQNQTSDQLSKMSVMYDIPIRMKNIPVKEKHIINVMEALGFNLALKRNLFLKLCKKYCIPQDSSKNAYWKGGPIEEIEENDDENSCKIFSLRVPKSWTFAHVKALLHIKTTHDPNARYVKMLIYKSEKSTMFHHCLLRFLTHNECIQVYYQLLGIKVFYKPIQIKLDIGYKLSKKTLIMGPLADLDIRLHTNQITLHEYAQLKKQLHLSVRSKSKVEKITFDSQPTDVTTDNITDVKKTDTSFNREKSVESVSDASLTIDEPIDVDMAEKRSTYSDISMEGSGDEVINEQESGDETDENHCRVLKISNLPLKSSYASMKILLKTYTSYGDNEFEFRKTYSGICFLQCSTHEKALQLIKELNGFEFERQKLELQLDIGHEASYNLLPKHRQFLLRNKTKYIPPPKRKIEKSQDSQSVDENPTKKVKYESVSSLPDVPAAFLPPREFNPSAYGLSNHILQSLTLRPPLSDSIFVNNMHKDVDEAKVREVFSLAGNIKYLKFHPPPYSRAKIVYEHPVEAVQAISMFHKQPLFNIEMFVKMDFNKKGTPLPLGLQTLGLGFGNNGRPLTSVKHHVELEKIKHMLSGLGVLKEVPLTDHPFSVTYVKPNTNAPFPPKQCGKQYQTTRSTNFKQTRFSPINNPRPSAPKINRAALANTASTSNQSYDESSPNTLNEFDDSAIALGAILAQHGLIDKNSKCQDLSSILNAIRDSWEKINQTASGNKDNPNLSAMVTDSYTAHHTFSNQNVTPTNNQYVQPQMVQNVQNLGLRSSNSPNFSLNAPNMSANLSNFEQNIPAMASNLFVNAPNATNQNVPNTWQHTNMSVPAVRWDHAPPMIPQVPNIPPPVLNIPPPVSNIPPPVPNIPPPVPNIPPPVPNIPPPVTNLPPPVPNFTQYSMPPPILNKPAPIQNVQQHFNQTMQGNQNYNQIIQQQYEAYSKQKDKSQDRYDDHTRGTIEKKKESDDSKSDMLLFNNLPPSVTVDALNTKMREIGEVMFGEITGQGRAIVRFKNSKDAERCIKLFHRSKVDSQIIEVSFI